MLSPVGSESRKRLNPTALESQPPQVGRARRAEQQVVIAARRVRDVERLREVAEHRAARVLARGGIRDPGSCHSRRSDGARTHACGGARRGNGIGSIIHRPYRSVIVACRYGRARARAHETTRHERAPGHARCVAHLPHHASVTPLSRLCHESRAVRFEKPQTPEERETQPNRTTGTTRRGARASERASDTAVLGERASDTAVLGERSSERASERASDLEQRLRLARGCHNGVITVS